MVAQRTGRHLGIGETGDAAFMARVDERAPVAALPDRKGMRKGSAVLRGAAAMVAAAPGPLTRQTGPVGERGCPAHRLGVQGRHAERAAAQCPAEAGADVPALTSTPVTVLHCRARVLFIFLFLSVSFLFVVLKGLVRKI